MEEKSQIQQLLNQNDQLAQQIRELRVRLTASRDDLKYQLGTLAAACRGSVFRFLAYPFRAFRLRVKYRRAKSAPHTEDEPYDRNSESAVTEQNKKLQSEKNLLIFYLNLDKKSGTYRVGTEVLRCGKSPIKYLMLPMRVMKVLKASPDASAKQPGVSAKQSDTSAKQSAASAERVGKLAFPVLSRIEGVGESVLFVATNGGGLGHLTRCLAVARRLKRQQPDLNIIFFTTSLALTIIQREGFIPFCVPYRMLITGINNSKWNILMRTQLMQLAQLYHFRAVVFDGTTPYSSISDVMTSDESIVKVWIKRGSDKTKELVEQRRADESKFDLVIMPTEAGGQVGAGEDSTDGVRRVRVNPIIFLNRDELWSREDVRRYLKIPEGKKAAYIQLGAGNINDIDTELGMIAQRIKSRGDIVMVIGESLIGHELKIIDDDIIVIKDYPNSKYLSGFDFAVSACGYNSFHELIFNAVPTLFIPNMNAKTDDQYARAMIAQELGAGLVIKELDAESVERALDTLTDDRENALMRRAARGIIDVNGAEEAARIISESMFLSN